MTMFNLAPFHGQWQAADEQIFNTHLVCIMNNGPKLISLTHIPSPFLRHSCCGCFHRALSECKMSDKDRTQKKWNEHDNKMNVAMVNVVSVETFVIRLRSKNDVPIINEYKCAYYMRSIG